MPHPHAAITRSRVELALRLISLKHIDVVTVGGQTARKFWEVRLSQIVKAKVLVARSAHQCRPVVEHREGSDYFEVWWLESRERIESAKAEGVNAVVATPVEDVTTRARQREHILHLLTFVDGVIVALTQIVDQ